MPLSTDTAEVGNTHELRGIGCKQMFQNEGIIQLSLSTLF